MITTLLAAAVLAGDFSQPPSLKPLHDRIVHTMSDAERREALQELTRTPPRTLDDIRLLFDIFMRYSDPGPREAAMSSVETLTPSSAPRLEGGFLELVKMEEPEAQLFGLKGLARLQSKAGSELVRTLAKRKFSKPSPTELPLPSERDAWFVTYQALDTLAATEPDKAKSLVAGQAAKTPRVARIYAARYWEDVLPKLKGWKAETRSEALRAGIPVESLRKTRGAMLAIVRDQKAPMLELRHPLALKVGMTSTPEEVAELLKEHETAKDEQTKLLLAAALFASRDPQIVPLLKKFALEHPNAQTRMGSLVQLNDMIPPAEAKTLLEAALKSDPDEENRDQIKSLLGR